MKRQDVVDLIQDAMEKMSLDGIKEALKSKEDILDFADKAGGTIHFLQDKIARATVDPDAIPNGVPVFEIQKTDIYVDALLQVANPYVPMLIQSHRFAIGDESAGDE